MTLAQAAFYAAVVLGVGSALVALALVLVRVARDRSARRREEARAPVWRVVLTLSTGEDEELDDAHGRLLAASPAERRAVEADAFALLPKLRGEARQRLREVLRAWGTTEGARHSTTSRSAVRRCRGYYRLGVLAEPGRRDQVLGGLADRSYTARRVAMLAAGSFPSDVTVERLLDRAVLEPPLRRDFLAAMDRIGHPAVPVLRDQLRVALRQVLEEPAAADLAQRRGQLAAEALGLVGALEAVPALEAALVDAPPEMVVACVHALGSLGSPSSVPALAGATRHPSPEVRRVAAQALGLVGGRAAVEPLAAVLPDASTEVARAAAHALWRCGPGGGEVLRASRTPVAREVLALASLGTS